MRLVFLKNGLIYLGTETVTQDAWLIIKAPKLLVIPEADENVWELAMNGPPKATKLRPLHDVSVPMAAIYTVATTDRRLWEL